MCFVATLPSTLPIPMNVFQQRWAPGTRLRPQPDAHLVLAFGDSHLMAGPACFSEIASAYPAARVVGCSSCGEIEGDAIYDGSIVLTALQFDHTRVALARVERQDGETNEALGARLGTGLSGAHEGLPLCHVFVLADGVHLNATPFVAGLAAALPPGVGVTGGLAGDDIRFVETPVWAEGVLRAPAAVAVGFYGHHLRVGWSAVGGWHPFGPDRLVTRATGNKLYTLDGQPALDLYKQYLGPHAQALPASGWLFPLAIRKDGEGQAIVRTTVGVDEAEGSLQFAGDVPEGTYARFMQTSHERLTDGATEAAEQAAAALGVPAELALLVSCAGRRQVMGVRTEDELEAVADALGPGVPVGGFYSHGELAPFGGSHRCDLHNQTMTITVLAETP